MVRIVVFTIFPELFPGPLGISIFKTASDNKIWSLEVVNVRNFSINNYGRVDDYPFGGGAGMVMRPDVLFNAIESKLKTETKNPTIIVTSAKGDLFCHDTAQHIASTIDNSPATSSIYIICGRFEGIDQRIIDHYKMQEISIGNFVLAGGEVACFAICEAILRLVNGVVGNAETLQDESFSIKHPKTGEALLEYPHYTQPRTWNGITVPEVLISGNHKKIKEWRLLQCKDTKTTTPTK